MAYPYSHSYLPGIYQSTGYYTHPGQAPPFEYQASLPCSGYTQVQTPDHIHATGYDSTGSIQSFGPTNIPSSYSIPPMNFRPEISNIYTGSPPELQEISFTFPSISGQEYPLQRMPATHGNVGTSEMLERARAAGIRSHTKPAKRSGGIKRFERIH